MSIEKVRMYRVVAAALVALCLSGRLKAACQGYDDTVPASEWRIDGGLQASCPAQNYPTRNWQGQT